MFVFNDYASMDLIQSHRTTLMALMLLDGRTTYMPKPLIHGVRIYSSLIMFAILVLLAHSQQKTTENMK
jgi:hypothetical protein